MSKIELVRQRFKQAHQHYAQHAMIQQKMCQTLVDLIQQYPVSHTRVFEIGCGIGNLTEQCLQQYAIDQYYLNDLYEEVQYNPQYINYPQTQFYWLIGDIQQQVFPQNLDLIVSSSTLQWIYPLDDLLQKSYHALNDQGYLCFSSFLTNNLKEIKALTGHGLTYYTLDQLKKCIETAGFSLLYIQQASFSLDFPSAYAVLQHLKYTGVTATGQTPYWTKQRLQQFYQAYQQQFAEYRLDSWYYPLSYDSVYVIAKKQKR